LVIFFFGGYGVYLMTSLPTNTIDTVEIETTTSLVQPKSDEKQDDSVLIFYSNSCPHCKIVEDYLAQNSKDLKLNIKSLKIDNPKTDKENIEIALSKIKECNLKDD
jgi:thiol-disulfide isomerase/thioredoxin